MLFQSISFSSITQSVSLHGTTYDFNRQNGFYVTCCTSTTWQYSLSFSLFSLGPTTSYTFFTAYNNNSYHFFFHPMTFFIPLTCSLHRYYMYSIKVQFSVLQPYTSPPILYHTSKGMIIISCSFSISSQF